MSYDQSLMLRVGNTFCLFVFTFFQCWCVYYHYCIPFSCLTVCVGGRGRYARCLRYKWHKFPLDVMASCWLEGNPRLPEFNREYHRNYVTYNAVLSDATMKTIWAAWLYIVYCEAGIYFITGWPHCLHLHWKKMDYKAVSIRMADDRLLCPICSAGKGF